MSKHLRRELDNLRGQLLEMASSVEWAVRRAIRALRERDTGAAREVIAGDGEIDQEENLLGEECLKVLALHQPVATDLRCTVAVLSIDTELERMADLAEGIAERAIDLERLPPVPIPRRLESMADLTVSMVRQSLDAFVKLDTVAARRARHLDDDVDRLNAEIIQELIAFMQESPEHVEPGVSLFSVVRHLKGIAGHARGVAEEVVYLVEGEVLRHRRTTAGAEE